MKARNLVAALQKTTNSDLDVTIVVDNSEYEFEIVGVSDSVNKKILALRKMDNVAGTANPGDSLENQEERSEVEASQEVEEEKTEEPNAENND